MTSTVGSLGLWVGCRTGSRPQPGPQPQTLLAGPSGGSLWLKHSQAQVSWPAWPCALSQSCPSTDLGLGGLGGLAHSAGPAGPWDDVMEVPWPPQAGGCVGV